MPHKQLSPDATCPCGSEQPHRDCCWSKYFEWVEDEDGTIVKAIPMSDDLKEMFGDAQQAFVEQHGREPGPDDLLFPDLPPPEHLEHMTVEAMKEAGIDPAIIYAYEQTGLLVSEENQHLISTCRIMSQRCLATRARRSQAPNATRPAFRRALS
jgi:hypothetical protein